MVARGEAIGAGIEDLAGDLRGEAKPTGGILDVDDREVDLILATERGEQVTHCLAARLADHVSDEE